MSKEWGKNCLEFNKPHKSRRRKDCMIQEYSTSLPHMLHTAAYLVIKLAIQVWSFSSKAAVLSSLMSSIFDLSFQNHRIQKHNHAQPLDPCRFGIQRHTLFNCLAPLLVRKWEAVIRGRVLVSWLKEFVPSLLQQGWLGQCQAKLRWHDKTALDTLVRHRLSRQTFQPETQPCHSCGSFCFAFASATLSRLVYQVKTYCVRVSQICQMTKQGQLP